MHICMHVWARTWLAKRQDECRSTRTSQSHYQLHFGLIPADRESDFALAQRFFQLRHGIPLFHFHLILEIFHVLQNVCAQLYLHLQRAQVRAGLDVMHRKALATAHGVRLLQRNLQVDTFVPAVHACGTHAQGRGPVPCSRAHRSRPSRTS